ncbi:hypothetical protein [Sutcliffiella deserti]|uniref:hypothetical protein n=1 Tax=Sutcliffiella deserti TaxID=2875501 RepID=UPI001CBE0186|nr:hypothetical protein [Sutcliffiella deserti]
MYRTNLTKPTTYYQLTSINVVDSIMGSGKSSWAIQFMNNAPVRKKFIYITPFTNEVERIISECTNREFFQPSNQNGTKLEDIKRLISEGMDIASTHSLFQRVDAELLELLEIEDYTLILDEVMNVISPLDEYTKSDLKLLHNEGIIQVDDMGFVHWNKPDYNSEEGYFTKIRNLANSGNLMMYEDEEGQPVVLYWTFPAESFKCFTEIYLLTYLFNGQIQRAYFDLFKIKYRYYSVKKEKGNYCLADYISHTEENRTHIKENINIYYASPTDKKDMNKIGSKRTDFSVSNLKTKSKQSAIKKVIRDNAYNFYRNKCKVPADEVMWTTFKDFKGNGGIAPVGLKDCFVEVTSRATNEYRDKSTCIYLANRFLNPVTKNFFAKQGVTIDEDIFALSELLQWVFRSRIREGKQINLYIPSKRMRCLLEQYLYNKL